MTRRINRPRTARARRARTLVLLGLSIVLALGCAVGVAGANGATAVTGDAGNPYGPRPTILRIAPGARSRPLPRSFFGLSVEYDELPLYERFLPSFERVLSLLKVTGNGPQVLRIGGESADFTFAPGVVAPGPGNFVLTRHWLARASALIRQARLRVLLDLDMERSTPSQAAREARFELSGLPSRKIIGFEIGNEPDYYSESYSGLDYADKFRAYAGKLKALAPRIPVLGPAIGGTATDLSWFQTLIALDRRDLGGLTGHRYPLNACKHRWQIEYPTVSRLLSARNIGGFARSVTRAVALAHASGLRFRLDEVNSVTCRGLRGVSNTFATALWAPDALFSLLATGLDAVNFHIRPTTINGPLAIDRSGFSARPLLYGLILFTRTLSPGGRLVRTSFSMPPGLKAWTVRVRGPEMRLLLINDSRRRRLVDAQLRIGDSATVQRLLARSLRATRGETLDGQHLGSDGRWIGRRSVSILVRRRFGYQLTVPGYSAALLSTGSSPASPASSSRGIEPALPWRPRKRFTS